MYALIIFSYIFRCLNNETGTMIINQKKINSILFIMVLGVSSLSAQEKFEKDIFNLDGGTLELYFIGHGTLMFDWNGTIIHIDPVSSEADYNKLPKADIILVTHEHGDHLDPSAVNILKKPGSLMFCNAASAGKLENASVMSNGETREALGIKIEAVPAYNVVNERSPGNPFHPKGNGNGYILEYGGTRIYIAGDTENIDEMGEFGKIDIAFLPVNLPYTMNPEMAAKAARMINPGVLYPYHFGSTDLSALVNLLKETGIDVRIRNME
jgi:L-ascorbate metabolism protein UlaG (beta-lactamase superfamily)